MVHVQYYWERRGEYVEALGDRAVVILDGRKALHKLKEDARAMNGVNRPKYAAYQIFIGKFTDRKPLTGICLLL